MDQIKLHKHKMLALVAAALGIISCFLPWWSIGIGPLSYSISGLHDLGILVFLAFIAAAVLTYGMSDKSMIFEEKQKLYVSIAFGVAALFTLIQYLKQTEFTAFGLWLSLLVAVAGGVIVYVVKPEQLESKPNVNV
jgi:predicted membrane channel-forming protein YqfA (hemolysin III family)